MRDILRNAMSTLKVFFILMILVQCIFSYEDLSSRALIAMTKDSGDVFWGWRFLNTDNPTTGFYVYRSTTSGSYGTPLNDGSTITTSTNYLDTTTVVGETYYYIVKPVNGGVVGAASNEAIVTASSEGKDYYDGLLVDSPGGTYGPADFNGDGFIDFHIRGSVSSGKSEPETYIAAYVFEPNTGNFSHIWTYDAGQAPYSCELNPTLAWNFDGDGYAEVALVRWDGDWAHGFSYVTPSLVILNGMTGEVIDSIEIPKDGSSDRYKLGVTYLRDSSIPDIVVEEGVYHNTCLYAYTWDLDSLLWSATGDDLGDHDASHRMVVGDVDGDGLDEILVGDNMIDNDGTLMWTLGRGHGDHNVICDVDPDEHNGLEVAFGFEAPWGPGLDSDGMLVRAINGSIIFCFDNRYSDVRETWVGNITDDYPGCEIYFRDELGDGGTVIGPTDICAADGTILQTGHTDYDNHYGIGSLISFPEPYEYSYIGAYNMTSHL